jgi:hypothetical protein
MAGMALFATLPAAAAGQPHRHDAATLVEGGASGCLEAKARCVLEPGSTVAEAGEFEASSRGATIRLVDGSLVRLSPGARAAVLRATMVPLGSGPPTRTQQLTLRSGRLAATVAHAGGRAHATAVLVRGPRGVSAIGSSGTLEARSKDDRVSFSLREGKGLIGVGGAWSELPEGQILSSDAGAPPVRRAALPAVAVLPSRTVATISDQLARPLQVRWAAVEDAVKYRVTIEPAGGGAAVAETAPTALSATLGALAPGEYRAVVRAMDAEGFESAPSPAVALNVVGCELPAGVAVDDGGAIRVAEGKQLTLMHAGGLEVAYEASRGFVGPPRAFGLIGEKPRALRLRRPGSGDEAVLLLAPRSVGAEVEVGPGTATWPRDAVDIRLRVVPTTDAPLPRGIEATAVVTLNLVPLAVTWTHDGQWLRATVPGQHIDGPAVLRVEVTDQQGSPLGRGHLELVPDASAVCM